MGFLRKWYRDNCANRKERAQIFLADGEYAKAASDFQGCDMYKQAADAYMKACEKKPDNFYYKWAAENYEKAGDFEAMRKACESAWRVKPHWLCLKKHFERLINHGQFEKFLENAKKKEPKNLASSLEQIEQYEIACDMYALAAEQKEDTKEKYHLLRRAIECGVNAAIDEHKLFQLHEEYFKADVAQAESWGELGFRGKRMTWVVGSGSLLKFIDDMVDEFPAFLWYVLHEFAIDAETSASTLKKNREILAKGMLRCVKVTENNPLLKKGWEFTNDEEVYYSETVMLLSTVGMFVDAAEILERVGKYKKAAGFAEDAGNVELAIRLYELALKEKGIHDSETDWIKDILQRLRKEREKPSATRPAQPEDYM